MSVDSPARLSTTSEGLWLTAALAGVTRLPAVLKIRPVGGVEDLGGHPGLEVLQQTGVCSVAGVLDPDVADWVMTLGRPDIEVDITISAPTASSAGRLTGPPPAFVPPEDPIEAYEALARWRARQPVQRAAALCRRDGWWVGAARVWQIDNPDETDSEAEQLDEVVVSPLGHTPISSAVTELLGAVEPAQFHGVSIEADVLDSIVTQWQSHPDLNVVAMLAETGMSVEQARIVEVVGDATAARAALSAIEHRVEGPAISPRAMMVADTVLGRVLISSNAGPDGRVWTMLTSGTEQRIAAALDDVLEALPSGTDWHTHQRLRK
ncbi:hypothetical protein ACT16_13155 [Mycobacterium heckeshornense]|nr:hypothetical protein ACT16_13155 [Mycobacterium heckeshornense]